MFCEEMHTAPGTVGPPCQSGIHGRASLECVNKTGPYPRSLLETCGDRVAGNQEALEKMDSRFRGNDISDRSLAFLDTL
jgi:hypothetical protein